MSRKLINKIENRCVKDWHIIFVQPSTQQSVQSLFTFHKNEGLGHKPPLSILILATYLKSNGFTNVSCLDAHLDDLTPSETVEQLKQMNPDVIGFTVWTDFWFPTWKTIQLVRKHLPECLIVLGGPHCSVYPQETLLSSKADYLVSGDGEDAILKLLKGLDNNRNINNIPGLWCNDGNKTIAPKVSNAIVEEVTKIPAPDRTLLPYKRYNSVLNSNDFETTMVTSRGCPHKCVFCKMHAQKVYARSADQVIEEFEKIVDMGITDIQIYDDTFTWSKKRVMAICKGIIEKNIKVNWAIRDRVSKADPEMYALMKKAGCYRIHFGVESGSPEILKASGKGVTLEQAYHAVFLAKKVGFSTMTYYMFGFLDEKYSDALKTIDVAKKMDTDYAVFAVLIPYPGTSLYETALSRAIIPHDFWREYTLNPTKDFQIPFLIEQHMDRNALITLKNKALRKYFFRPKIIARELVNISSIGEIRRKLSMAMNILTESIKP